jgi:hypothetical protein
MPVSHQFGPRNLQFQQCVALHDLETPAFRVFPAVMRPQIPQSLSMDTIQADKFKVEVLAARTVHN